MVASFENQIRSEYYGGNRSLSIEEVSLNQYKKVQQTQLFCELGKPTRHSVFYSFFLLQQTRCCYYNFTQKTPCLVVFLSNILFADISIIW